MQEFDIIQLAQDVSQVSQSIQLGIGDDCAILSPSGSPMVCSTDILNEGIHFTRLHFSPEEIAWKSLAVNLSDLAAMGARPIGFLLALSLIESLSDDWVTRFFKGLKDCAESYGISLIGGDTVASKSCVSIAVTVLGEAPTPLLRKQPNLDSSVDIWSTGHFGRASAGLHCLNREILRFSDLTQAQKRPLPRLAEGQTLQFWMNQNPEKALVVMDCSDGLASGLATLCAENQMDGLICFESLPISSELLALGHQTGESITDWILYGGEDYELLVFMPAKTPLLEGFTKIGHAKRMEGHSPSLSLSKNGVLFPIQTSQQYQHFQS